MTAYLAFNACLVVLLILFKAFGRTELVAARLALSVAGALALGAAWLPMGEHFERPARLLTGFAREGLGTVARVAGAGRWNAAQAAHAAPGFEGWGVLHHPSVIVLALALIAAIRLAWGWLAIARAARAWPATRRLGRVRVLAASSGVPFAARVPGLGALIVLPLELWRSLPEARVAIRHELEHHRNADTLWVSALEFLRVACFWNPAAHAWARLMCELQEFACDEALVGRGSVSPQAYGRCLVKVAEMALGSRPMPVGATGMAARAPGSLLIRRLDMLIQGHQKTRSFPAAWAACSLVAAVLVAGTVAVASAGVTDRRLTAEEAGQLAARLAPQSHLPITVNELVLRELNRYLGSPGTRESLREGFARETKVRGMIDRATGEYGLPPELAIVPMHESRFQNLAWSPGAGLWGFIKSTARRYELVVDDDTDERLDEEKETGAAMRYFSKLHSEFHDWRLALLAYNEGEQRVEHKIARFKTRDAWELERHEESREHYLASITALMIISGNRQLLN